MKEQVSPELLGSTLTLKVGFISLAGSGWKTERRVQEYREDC